MPNSPRPLLITGCGRSGTFYTSILFTMVGATAKHEAIFTGRESDTGIIPAGHVESSWFAMPFLHKLNPNTLVLHQVRHPLHTIRSYHSRRFFHPAPVRQRVKHGIKHLLRRPSSGSRRLVEMVQKAVPEVFLHPTPLERCARFWVSWNRRIETDCDRLGLQYQRVQVEQLDEDTLASILQKMGQSASYPIDEAFDLVPKDLNTRAPCEPIRWRELGATAASVQRLAATYGYDDLRDRPETSSLFATPGHPRVRRLRP